MKKKKRACATCRKDECRAGFLSQRLLYNAAQVFSVNRLLYRCAEASGKLPEQTTRPFKRMPPHGLTLQNYKEQQRFGALYPTDLRNLHCYVGTSSARTGQGNVDIAVTAAVPAALGEIS